MTNTTNVKQLKLNIMTQAQYDTITPSPSELYMITDAEVVPVDDAISSTSENPVQNKVVYTALNGKQDTLVSGTNIKTVNNSSLLGSGNITIDSLPSQSGQSGKFLTTNGTTASWSTISMPTNYVTTDTAQDISGRKTFLGEKAIYFKQVATSNKLGFTLYNPSNTELAALEYRPNTISGASLLALNCPQTTGGYVGFRYWGTPAVNIVAPKVATAGNYFMTTHITDGTNTVTANNQGTVNISTLLPDVSNYVTNSSLATTLADYVLSSDLSTTLADYVTSTNLTTILDDYATKQWATTQASALATDLQTWVGNQGYLTDASLSTLTDVALSNPTQGQNLTYDATLGKWKNTSTTATVAWGGITGTLSDQTDLSIALNSKLQANNSNVTFSNDGTMGSVSYVDSSAGEMYGTFIGQTQWGDGVMMGAVNPEGYLLGVSPTGVGIVSGTASTPLNTVMLTVTEDDTLAINDNEVALKSDLSTKQDTLVSGTNIKTVNNASLLGSGNITIDSLPSQSGQSGKFLTTNGTTASWSTISIPTVDQTFDSSSANAQSGVAIAGAGFLQNTATATDSLTILGTTNNHSYSVLIGTDAAVGSDYNTVIGNRAYGNGTCATALGYYARANGQYATAIGNSSYANYNDVTAVGNNTQATAAGTLTVGSQSKATAQRATSIGYSSQATQYQATSLGYEAKATANSALQIGTGTNSTANTLQVSTYTLLDTSTGLIPDARISSNIARTSQITTPTYDSTNERITW